ncbi:endonuclease 8-like 2 isoform X2 [Dasypus novemcinctus]|nr:endonuclease 8-like 2 isoform X2 [Dasypus novemcinctus]
MPEGPSVRKFHRLVTPFVGQQVAKTGGSSRKLCPADLQALWLRDVQVHGKKLFLRFDTGDETGRPGNSPLPEPLQKEEAGTWELGGQEIPVLPPGAAARVAAGSEGEGADASAGHAERWLQVGFGLFGSVWVNEFSRAKKANKRGDWRDPVPRLVLYFGDGGFLAFYNCQMSWRPHPVVRPACDILSEKFHRGQALQALGQAQPVCYTLLDQRYFSGLGNIIKNEALYRAGIHPLSLGSLLSPARLESLVDQVVEFSAGWLQGKFRGQRQHPQIYQKERCPAGHQAVRAALGPPGGFQRLTWWCPQCQPRLPPEEPGSLLPPGPGAPPGIVASGELDA